MGINYLHPFLASTARTASLHEICALECFQNNRHERGVGLVGIDISHMMESISRSPNQYHQQKGLGSELKEVFRRLSGMLNYSIIPVFVFDGDQRPNIKRDIRVIKKAHWMTEPTKELIEAFGFYHHDAPGEAEAELAMMSRLHILDLVVTEDSDTMVFGAQHVARNFDWKAKTPTISVYSRDAITQMLGITRGGLVLFALTAGGDYDKIGLAGCGGSVAGGLARTNLGDNLLEAFYEMSQDEFEDFVHDWRRRLVLELRTNASGHLPHLCGKIADNISSTFPSYNVLSLYASPLVSPTVEDVWQPRSPNIPRLLELCGRYFGNSLGTLYRKYLIPGLFYKIIQLETSKSDLYNAGIDEQDIIAIIGDVDDSSASPGFTLSQLRVCPDGLFLCHPSMKEDDGTRHRYHVNVPRSMLTAFFPDVPASSTTSTYIPVLSVLRTLEKSKSTASCSAQPFNTALATVNQEADHDTDMQSSDTSSVIIAFNRDDDAASIISISSSNSDMDDIVIDLTASDSE